MTNLVLFKSSCINGTLIGSILAYAYYYKLLPKYIIAVLLTVIGTSLLNHKTTNTVAKWCDRIFAILSISFLSIYIYSTKKTNRVSMFILLFLICAFYYLAKVILPKQAYISNTFHIFSHISATGLIIMIVINR
jgi:hypothetical protein